MISKLRGGTIVYVGTPKSSYEAGRKCARILYEYLIQEKKREAQNRNHPDSVGNGTGVNHDPVLHGHSKAEPIKFNPNRKD